jgi:hypothetical protein
MAVWYMDGWRRVAVGVVEAETDFGWAAVTMGDFNGDGRPDIVWRHSRTGANRIWYMDGHRKTGADALDTEADLAWQIVGTGDFNGDGKTDILWRNCETGALRIWYMDGITRAGLGTLNADCDCPIVISAEELERQAQLARAGDD